MKHAVILGGGMVGSAMATDMKAMSQARVTVVDANAQALDKLATEHGIDVKQADLGKPDGVKAAVADADIVLGALSSALGHQTLKAVIDAGKDYVDISFMAEDALALHQRALDKGVCAVVDCGVGPGVSNMCAGHAAASLDSCTELLIYVAGLPVERHWPYEYKAAFAPSDVIEEYVRPARQVVGGEVVVKEALTDRELIQVDGLGTLEAFNTDGLRSLIQTLDIPNMTEKTMRYPGHIDIMQVMRDTGMFSTDPIEVDGRQVRPLDVTSAVLFPKWAYEEGERDLTAMQVIARGKKNGAGVEMRWDLLDTYDDHSKVRSMSRTTAYPASIMAQMMLKGRFGRPGVHPPEIPGAEPGFLDDMLAALKERGVHYVYTEKGLKAP